MFFVKNKNKFRSLQFCLLLGAKNLNETTITQNAQVFFNPEILCFTRSLLLVNHFYIFPFNHHRNKLHGLSEFDRIARSETRPQLNNLVNSTKSIQHQKAA